MSSADTTGIDKSNDTSGQTEMLYYPNSIVLHAENYNRMYKVNLNIETMKRKERCWKFNQRMKRILGEE